MFLDEPRFEDRSPSFLSPSLLSRPFLKAFPTDRPRNGAGPRNFRHSFLSPAAVQSGASNATRTHACIHFSRLLLFAKKEKRKKGERKYQGACFRVEHARGCSSNFASGLGMAIYENIAIVLFHEIVISLLLLA